MSKLAFPFLVICLQSVLSSADSCSSNLMIFDKPTNKWKEANGKACSSIGGFCPSGWVTYKGSSSCYRMGTRPTKLWTEARRACLSMGGDLVKIRSAQENRYVALLARTYSSNTKMWIGLVRDSNNVFNWVDGSFLTGQYSNWHSGEPNNNNDNESCGMMYLSSMGWNDGTCGEQNGLTYVCEKEKLS